MIAIGNNELDALIHTGSEIGEIYIGTERYWPDHNLILVLKSGSAVPQLWQQSGEFSEEWPQEYNAQTRTLSATIPDHPYATAMLLSGLSIERVIAFPEMSQTEIVLAMFDGTEISAEDLNKILGKIPKNADLMDTFHGIKLKHIKLEAWPTTETNSLAGAFDGSYVGSEQVFRAVTFGAGCSFHKGLYVYNTFRGKWLQLIDMSACDLSKLEDCTGMFSGIKGCYEKDFDKSLPHSNVFSITEDGRLADPLIFLPKDQSKCLSPVNGTSMFEGSKVSDDVNYDNFKLDMSRLKIADKMFSRFSGTLDLTSLDPDSLVSYDKMFEFCSAWLTVTRKFYEWFCSKGVELCGNANTYDFLKSDMTIVD